MPGKRSRRLFVVATRQAILPLETIFAKEAKTMTHLAVENT